MKTIKQNGVVYSALSERGKQIKRYKRTHKRESTVIPRSIMLAAAIIPIVTQITT